MMGHAQWIGEGDELTADECYQGPAVYAVDVNGIVAGPFDDDDQCDWWLSKAQRVS
jgi:hypothetical protein